MQRRSRSTGDLRAIAVEFLVSLKLRAAGATVVTLSGELGAGKTTFAQALARELGVEEAVTSPTFVIEKVYRLKGQRWQRLIHIDAYRLRFAKELAVLGWDQLLADPGDLIVLEWPEKVPELIPADAVRVRIDIQGEERIITIDGSEEKSGAGKEG
jgi:tRNA threonylcarbamoyladenosine biosynthesis protein TsaE